MQDSLECVTQCVVLLQMHHPMPHPPPHCPAIGRDLYALTLPAGAHDGRGAGRLRGPTCAPADEKQRPNVDVMSSSLELACCNLHRNVLEDKFDT